MLRILHVAPSIARGYGGPTSSLFGYATAAASQGMSVSIIAPHSDEAGEFKRRLETVELQTFPAFGRGAFVTSPGLWWWLRRHLREYDVVHVHGLLNPVSSGAISLAVSRGQRVVVRPFGMLSRYTFMHRRRVMKAIYFRVADGRNLACASAIHFTTAGEQRNARWHNFLTRVPQFVIPPPYTSGSVARTTDERDETFPRVVFVGRLEPVKNLESLIDAWPAVLRAFPSAHLTLAGEGDPAYAARLRDRVVVRELQPHVKFAGFVDHSQRDRLLASADAFVLPSFHENFGVAALEAAHAGVPVVVSPDVQLADFLEEKGLGVVAGGGASGLAVGVIGVLRNCELRSRCAASGRDIVTSTFAVSRVGEALATMYHGVVEGHAHPAA